jgi:hypothetical protein
LCRRAAEALSPPELVDLAVSVLREAVIQGKPQTVESRLRGLINRVEVEAPAVRSIVEAR